MSSPGLGDCRVFSAPWAFREGVQFLFSDGLVLRPVDLLQRRNDSLAVPCRKPTRGVGEQCAKDAPRPMSVGQERMYGPVRSPVLSRNTFGSGASRPRCPLARGLTQPPIKTSSMEVFGSHGLPMSLYTDRGAHYFYIADGGRRS